jgi:homogentisate phytyltransferase/homogentisate geranylgeranyltransferase
MSIIVVRGTLVNLGFFLDAKSSVMGVTVGDTIGAVLGTALQFPESIAATAYFAIFGTIIAIMKDVPDIIGDRLFSIPSFSVQLGAARVFTFAWQLLFSLLSIGSMACFSAFLTPILAGQSMVGRTSTMVSRLVAGALLGFLGKDVRKRARVVKAEDSESVFKYYMHLWNVFYACYVIMPFLRT